MPNSIAVKQPETADEIIFVRFDCDVDSNDFSSELSTCLFDSKGFTIARKTSDEGGIEDLGLDDLLDGREVAERNKVVALSGHQTHSSRSLKGTLNRLYGVLSHFKIPLAATNFILLKVLGNGLICDTFRSTVSTNISSNKLAAVEIAEGIDVVQLRHDRFRLYVYSIK